VPVLGGDWKSHPASMSSANLTGRLIRVSNSANPLGGSQDQSDRTSAPKKEDPLPLIRHRPHNDHPFVPSIPLLSTPAAPFIL
jgi:hypothetical protein